jgi:hypothetical protein
MDKVNRARSVLAVCLGIFALVMLAPVAANAQVTIVHVKVVVGSGAGAVSYCDTGTAGCSVQPWNLGAGVLVPANTNLVLTQTGFLTGIGGNFDTSDRANATSVPGCKVVGDCPVSIFIDTGSGFGAAVYGPNNANQLNNFSLDPDDGIHAEGVKFASVASTISYDLSIGYADNEHSNGLAPGAVAACSSTLVGTLCFPSPWQTGHVPTGGVAADQFIGGFVTANQIASIGPNAPQHDLCDGYCFDGGALLIAAKQVPVGACPLTQGFWKTHAGFGPGKQPNAWPNVTVTVDGITYSNGSMTIGGTTYSKTDLVNILNTPPSGGNAVLILAHQLIAAVLNVANGSTDLVLSTITDANGLLNGISLTNGFVAASSIQGQKMVADADILDNFNSGGLTPVCTGPR